MWNFVKMLDILSAQKLTIIGILTCSCSSSPWCTARLPPRSSSSSRPASATPALSLPYHIGNGWFGGLLPATSFAMVAPTGDIYYGLWYPIVIAMMTFVIGLFFVPETNKRDIFSK